MGSNGEVEAASRGDLGRWCGDACSDKYACEEGGSEGGKFEQLEAAADGSQHEGSKAGKRDLGRTGPAGHGLDTESAGGGESAKLMEPASWRRSRPRTSAGASWAS